MHQWKMDLDMYNNNSVKTNSPVDSLGESAQETFQNEDSTSTKDPLQSCLPNTRTSTLLSELEDETKDAVEDLNTLWPPLHPLSDPSLPSIQFLNTVLIEENEIDVEFPAPLFHSIPVYANCKCPPGIVSNKEEPCLHIPFPKEALELTPLTPVQWPEPELYLTKDKTETPSKTPTVASSTLEGNKITQLGIQLTGKPPVEVSCKAVAVATSGRMRNSRVVTTMQLYCTVGSGVSAPSFSTNEYFKAELDNSTFLDDNSSTESPSEEEESEELPECPVCGYEATDVTVMKRHLNKHTSEDKPYRCSQCGKRYGRFEYLTRHKRTHKEERPYRCEVCEVAFKVPAYLKAHVKKKMHLEKVQEQQLLES